MAKPKLASLGGTVASIDMRSARPTPKVALGFYQSPEWRALVTAVVNERGRRCERCGKTHDGEGQPIRVFADHIRELKDGGAPLDRRNLQLLCGKCHGVKTQARKMERLGFRSF